ncbi:tagaturonate epimerase family protein [Phycisphaera mikurensis]|uniref:Tagaturonate/fructuronate epimerase n=1 Tax=Phycisphaera mikurensis (strain NBRC 102666 / KCTC 22515 / FYK2301M01) TaxID=1142394 RepID=I0IEV8_PHYMF|nr:tagaturonate epimerase family protein [Phycisphaera mikurensis]MBB6441591.1 hypothetical protein [Phycisphaera mikurensis]BAM03796.1 hypothetical protein PSMK_16370 [Phycisphaera mikurensis NBRC 102666]
MLALQKLSFGVGDRFAHQAAAQLRAFRELEKLGPVVTPVWNKSNREHTFIGSEPAQVREAAAAAVEAAGWSHPWHVDADHINLGTVDAFTGCSDFFTIDVADAIGKPSDASDVDAFIARHRELIGTLEIDGLGEPLTITEADVRATADHFLLATRRAGEVHRHIAARRGDADFIAEVSMDETPDPQTPPVLLVILAALADAGVPLQTIAPKFTGRFNKGVDYVGDLACFEREFNDDVAVIRHAVAAYGLPENLKLSVHSGSDKFSLYPIIHRSMRATGAGVHLKTAGTTWLEEVIGLAESGGEALDLVRDMYAYALGHVEELCAPYADVIDVDPAALPGEDEVRAWDGPRFAQALRHVPGGAGFDPAVRQLIHVSFKVAAREGERYTRLLKENEAVVGEQVTQNLLERHMKPLFLGSAGS